MAMVLSTGPGSTQPAADATAPSTIDQGMGLVSMPRMDLRSAVETPCAPATSRRESAMQSDVVMIMSIAIVRITGPALC